MSLVIDEHRQYLSDRARLDAFERAIAAVVRPGDVVVDLGCGTGILGLLACRAGARRVYAIDDGGMIEIARAVARANGYGDRITHITGHSTRVSLPERADVLISDQIGRLGFELGIVECYSDAARRFLKPGARVIPIEVATCVAPVESSRLFDHVEFWREPHAGFTFADIREPAVNTGYPSDMTENELLATPAPVVRYPLENLANVDLPIVSGQSEFTIARDGVLHGLAGWFEAVLAPAVVMTNGVGSANRIQRRPAFLPFDRPTPVVQGDRVMVALVARPAEVLLIWRAGVERSGTEIARFDHTTLRGMLLTRADLERTRPDAQPRLNASARARTTVLALADGRRTLREIERQTYERHRDIFPDLGEAAAFVAAVISRDAADAS